MDPLFSYLIRNDEEIWQHEWITCTIIIEIPSWNFAFLIFSQILWNSLEILHRKLLRCLQELSVSSFNLLVYFFIIMWKEQSVHNLRETNISFSISSWSKQIYGCKHWALKLLSAHLLTITDQFNKSGNRDDSNLIVTTKSSKN